MKKTNHKFKPIDCFQCQHLYITWDEDNPKGCTAFGFKTKRLPSLVVFETSGENCHHFCPKTPKPKPKKKRGWVA
ncbi:MAG TPA: uracil-DNA glycosylase [Thiomicrospira sp.]|jgi:hypothetical protein|nr:uracil-DNA glycosylase [Thiomicrospira sp.]